MNGTWRVELAGWLEYCQEMVVEKGRAEQFILLTLLKGERRLDYCLYTETVFTTGCVFFIIIFYYTIFTCKSIN